MDWTENLFIDRRRVHATSWLDRWSTTQPVAKADLIETGHGRGHLAVDRGSIWVANATSETLTRIERRTALAEWQTDLDRRPVAIATGRDAVWVLAENGWLWRFRSDGTSEGVARTGHGARDLACDEESAWVLQRDGDLAAFDQSTGEVTVEAKIPRGARQLACSRLRSTGWGALARVDLETMAVETTYGLPNAPRAIVGGAGHLWVACGRRGDRASEIVRVHPASGEITPWAKTEFTVHDLAMAGNQLVAAVGTKISIDVGGVAGG